LDGGIFWALRRERKIVDVKPVVGKEKSEEEGEGEGEGDLSESSGKSRVTYSGSWATDKEGDIFSHFGKEKLQAGR
jgi:hypothetical protein